MGRNERSARVKLRGAFFILNWKIYKPGSVIDNHSSRHSVTKALMRSTRMTGGK